MKRKTIDEYLEEAWENRPAFSVNCDCSMCLRADTYDRLRRMVVEMKETLDSLIPLEGNGDGQGFLGFCASECLKRAEDIVNES